MNNHGRWLLDKVQNNTCLGDASWEIRDHSKRLDVANEIPNGWRLESNGWIENEKTWILTRMFSPSIQTPMILVACNTLAYLSQTPRSERKREYSTVYNMLRSCPPEEKLPVASMMQNLLRYDLGGGYVTDKDMHVPSMTDVEGLEESIGEKEAFPLEKCMHDFTRTYIAARSFQCQSLEPHDIIACRDQMLDYGFPLQPGFDGTLLRAHSDGMFATLLGLKALDFATGLLDAFRYNEVLMDDHLTKSLAERNVSRRDVLEHGTRAIEDISNESHSYMHLTEVLCTISVYIAGSIFPLYPQTLCTYRDNVVCCISSLFDSMSAFNRTATEKYMGYLDARASEEELMNSIRLISTLSLKDNAQSIDEEKLFAIQIAAQTFASDESSVVERVDALYELKDLGIRSLVSSAVFGKRNTVSLEVIRRIPYCVLKAILYDDELVRAYTELINEKDDKRMKFLAPTSVWGGEDSMDKLLEML